MRVPLRTRAQLDALVRVTGLSRWRLFGHALDCFQRDLPRADQRLVRTLSARSSREGTL